MNLGIQDRVALVCAASRGIGRATAESLASEGARVAICARDERGLAEAVADIARSTGRSVLAVQADLRKTENHARLHQDVVRQLGPIDILVTNSGGPPPGGIDSVSDEDWAAAISALMLAPMHLIKACLPSMKERRWGRVIAISSTAALQPVEDLLISSSVRAANGAFMKAMARSLAASGVLLNTVCPGPTATARMVDLAASIARARGISNDEATKVLTADVPMGRLGRPEEVASVITLLASDRLSFCTGLTLSVDGGQVRSFC